jgi:hypothetical protein
MLLIKVADFDLALDEYGLNRLIADGSVLNSFRRACPTSHIDVVEASRLWTRADLVLKNSLSKINLHIFETNNKINDQVVWQMEQHGCEIDQIFPNEKHIFSYISWHESLEKKSEVPECELYLNVAVDPSKDAGKKYFDNMFRLLSAKTKGSKFILTVGLEIHKCFITEGRGINDLSKVSCFPCNDISIQTNVF